MVEKHTSLSCRPGSDSEPTQHMFDGLELNDQICRAVFFLCLLQITSFSETESFQVFGGALCTREGFLTLQGSSNSYNMSNLTFYSAVLIMSRRKFLPLIMLIIRKHMLSQECLQVLGSDNLHVFYMDMTAF